MTTIRDTPLAPIPRSPAEAKAISADRGSQEAHDRLVKKCLQALALMGFAAWENPRRAVKVEGRWLSVNKAGRGDIQTILPRTVSGGMVGVHAEVECKTGDSGQSKKQRGHMRMVRSNGGVYLVTRSAEQMRADLAALGFSPRL